MLITSAVREGSAKYSLEHLARAIQDVDLATSLVGHQFHVCRVCLDSSQDALALLPLLVPSPDSGADNLIELISREGSAKEAIMATQEIVEHLELDPDAEEAADDDLWLIRQIARALKVYALG